MLYFPLNLRQNVKAPESLASSRLLYRRPCPADAGEIFSRYASDPAITRFMGFPTHQSLKDTRDFLSTCDADWERWPAGAYLVRSRDTNTLVGSTGLHFETPSRAMTGYIFARDAWNLGYATEALGTMAATAASVGIRRLYAICHTAHEPSRRVLEKGGFTCEGILRKYMVFPNFAPDEPADVFCYALIL